MSPIKNINNKKVIKMADLFEIFFKTVIKQKENGKKIPIDDKYRKCSYIIPLIGMIPIVGEIVIKNHKKEKRNTGYLLKYFRHRSKIPISIIIIKKDILEKYEITTGTSRSMFNVFGKKISAIYSGIIEKKVNTLNIIFVEYAVATGKKFKVFWKLRIVNLSKKYNSAIIIRGIMLFVFINVSFIDFVSKRKIINMSAGVMMAVSLLRSAMVNKNAEIIFLYLLLPNEIIIVEIIKREDNGSFIPDAYATASVFIGWIIKITDEISAIPVDENIFFNNKNRAVPVPACKMIPARW